MPLVEFPQRVIYWYKNETRICQRQTGCTKRFSVKLWSVASCHTFFFWSYFVNDNILLCLFAFKTQLGLLLRIPTFCRQSSEYVCDLHSCHHSRSTRPLKSSCIMLFIFTKRKNVNVYFMTYCTNTRLVWTYLNAFSMVIPNIIMKFHNFEIFGINIVNILPRDILLRV